MRSQASNQMGDGPDLFEMGWLNKSPVIATAAASSHQGISHRPKIPGAVVINVALTYGCLSVDNAIRLVPYDIACYQPFAS
jgi:hypothetical protein